VAIRTPVCDGSAGATPLRGLTDASAASRCDRHARAHAVCEENTYSADGVTCKQCPAGSSSAAGAGTCACAAGYASSGVGDSLVCTPCEPGTAAAKGAPTCSVCPANTYSPAISGTCLPCPSASTSTAQSATCKCNAGFKAIGTGTTLVCEICPAGTKSAAGDTTCTPCEKGTYNIAAGSTTCSSLCNPGMYGVIEGGSSLLTACSYCPVGTYQTEAGQTFCVQCGEGTFGSSAGSPLSSACQACPAGTFQNTTGQSTCLQCRAGTFSAAGASFCSTCPAGSSSVAGSASCACDKGFFGETGYTTSEPCQVCPINTYASSTASTSCTPCPAGYYTVGPSNTSPGACLPCSAGKFTTGTGDDCASCPRGTYSANPGSSSCTPCPAGRDTVNAGSTDSLACVLCPPGNYSAGGGQVCTPCPVNHRANLGGFSGSTGCVPCAANTDTRGVAGSTSCSPCPAGSGSSGNGDACQPCPAGHFSVQGGGCTVCPANTYSGPGSTICIQCPAGTDTRGEPGSTSPDACLACPAGHFSPGNGAACEPCPANTFTNGTSEGATSCAACPAGTDTAGTTGNTAVTGCVQCAAGRFSPGNGEPCTDCPPGTYGLATAGATTCTPCPANRYNPTPGQTALASCLQCPTNTLTDGTGKASVSDCLCKAGMVGTITSATSTCQTCSAVCHANAACPGGTTCGGCQAGYIGDGVTCIAGMTKLATVRTGPNLNTTTCSGMPYSAATCSACANLGTGVALTGAAADRCVSGAQSPCCNLPVFFFEYVGATATQYPYMEFNVATNAADVPRLCVGSMRISFTVADGTVLCNSPGVLTHWLEPVLASSWCVGALLCNGSASCPTNHVERRLRMAWRSSRGGRFAAAQERVDADVQRGQQDRDVPEQPHRLHGRRPRRLPVRRGQPALLRHHQREPPQHCEREHPCQQRRLLVPPPALLHDRQHAGDLVGVRRVVPGHQSRQRHLLLAQPVAALELAGVRSERHLRGRPVRLQARLRRRRPHVHALLWLQRVRRQLCLHRRPHVQHDVQPRLPAGRLPVPAYVTRHGAVGCGGGGR